MTDEVPWVQRELSISREMRRVSVEMIGIFPTCAARSRNAKLRQTLMTRKRPAVGFHARGRTDPHQGVRSTVTVPT